MKDLVKEIGESDLSDELSRDLSDFVRYLEICCYLDHSVAVQSIVNVIGDMMQVVSGDNDNENESNENAVIGQSVVEIVTICLKEDDALVSSLGKTIFITFGKFLAMDDFVNLLKLLNKDGNDDNEGNNDELNDDDDIDIDIDIDAIETAKSKNADNMIEIEENDENVAKTNDKNKENDDHEDKDSEGEDDDDEEDSDLGFDLVDYGAFAPEIEDKNKNKNKNDKEKKVNEESDGEEEDDDEDDDDIIIDENTTMNEFEAMDQALAEIFRAKNENKKDRQIARQSRLEKRLSHYLMLFCKKYGNKGVILLLINPLMEHLQKSYIKLSKKDNRVIKNNDDRENGKQQTPKSQHKKKRKMITKYGVPLWRINTKYKKILDSNDKISVKQYETMKRLMNTIIGTNVNSFFNVDKNVSKNDIENIDSIWLQPLIEDLIVLISKSPTYEHEILGVKALVFVSKIYYVKYMKQEFMSVILNDVKFSLGEEAKNESENENNNQDKTEQKSRNKSKKKKGSDKKMVNENVVQLHWLLDLWFGQLLLLIKQPKRSWHFSREFFDVCMARIPFVGWKLLYEIFLCYDECKNTWSKAQLFELLGVCCNNLQHMAPEYVNGIFTLVAPLIKANLQNTLSLSSSPAATTSRTSATTSASDESKKADVDGSANSNTNMNPQFERMMVINSGLFIRRINKLEKTLANNGAAIGEAVMESKHEILEILGKCKTQVKEKQKEKQKQKQKQKQQGKGNQTQTNKKLKQHKHKRNNSRNKGKMNKSKGKKKNQNKNQSKKFKNKKQSNNSMNKMSKKTNSTKKKQNKTQNKKNQKNKNKQGNKTQKGKIKSTKSNKQNNNSVNKKRAKMKSNSSNSHNNDVPPKKRRKLNSNKK